MTLCLVSTQEYKTLADIALGVVETLKLPHHDKVTTPYAGETLEFWPIFINIGLLILPFQTLKFCLSFYTHWFSDLLVLNIGILALFQ